MGTAIETWRTGYVFGAALVAVLAAQWTVAASTVRAADSLTAAVRTAVEDPSGRDAAAFRRSSVRFEGLATAERLPKAGDYLVEVAIGVGERRLRYPCVVRRDRRGEWNVRWRPVRAYTSALFRLASGGDLLTLQRSGGGGAPGEWASRPRVPALPILLVDGAAILPTGRARLGGAEGLEPARSLRRAVSTWTRRVGQRDDALAAVDILADEGATWRDLMTVLYAVSGTGVFRVNVVVGSGDGRLRVVRAAAPVFGADRARSLVVALDRSVGGRRALRVVLGAEQLAVDEPCAPGVSLCVSGVDAVSGDLRALLEGARHPSVEHVVFAATADVPLRLGLRYALATAAGLGVDPGRLILSYVGARNRSGPSGREGGRDE
ncbi:MAG: hypothetical protein ABEL76_10965 [Bradymonadaceae bacterium]